MCKFWPIWHGLQIWALVDFYSWNVRGSHGIPTGICWRTEPTSSAWCEMAVPQTTSPCPYAASPLGFGNSLCYSAMGPSIPFSTFSLRTISNTSFGVFVWCSSSRSAKHSKVVLGDETRSDRNSEIHKYLLMTAPWTMRVSGRRDSSVTSSPKL